MYHTFHIDTPRKTEPQSTGIARSDYPSPFLTRRKTDRSAPLAMCSIVIISTQIMKNDLASPLRCKPCALCPRIM